MKFTKKETAYFLSLVKYNQASNAEEKVRYFDDVVSLRPLKAKSLQTDQQEYFSRRYYSAIRELVTIKQVSDNYKHIAQMLTPKISVNEVREALELLERLGLIQKNSEGFYERIDTVITAAGSSIDPSAIKKYQSETMDLAKNALYTIHKDKRDISTLTLSINEKDTKMIKKRIDSADMLCYSKGQRMVDRLVIAE